jgi:glycosyltransferase involved in cell wall biosynthesis
MCVIVTVDITLLNLCRGRFEYFTRHGFEVTAVCAPTPHADELRSRGIRLHTAPLARAMAPGRDLAALWNLWRFLRRERFDLVEVSTPKAALVGSIAAWLARVPCVVQLLRGLAYEDQGRIERLLLRWSQKLSCSLPHRVVAISQSLRDKVVADGVCRPDKITVLGEGSSNGIDLDYFTPAQAGVHDPVGMPDRRRAHDLPADAVVIGFVGRMTGDKGITELIDAFVDLAASRPDVYLLLVGDYEARDQPPTRTVQAISEHPRIRHVGWRQDTRPYYAAMDIFALPSYREGLGHALLEAAAMRLPTVTSDVTGCRSAIVAGTTGFLVPPKDTAALRDALATLIDDPDLRRRMGAAGRQRIERSFASEVVWSLQEQEYRRLLAERGVPLPPPKP